MSYHSDTPTPTEQHLQLWIYFLPVVGIVPAIWTLYRLHDSKNLQQKPFANVLRRQQKASRKALNLSLVWLSSYVLFSWGAGNASEILAFRMLYANAIITTGYFVACTYSMFRSKPNISPSQETN